MATYDVELTNRARKQYRALDKPVRARIREALSELAHEPTPLGVKALTGHADLLRIRVGDWRVIYRAEHDRLLIIVIDIGHRREIYR